MDVDISEGMVAEARRLNAGCARCAFVVNEAARLRRFPDASFDLLDSTLVLQHLPSRRLVAGYVAEFVRLASPGGRGGLPAPELARTRPQGAAGRRVYHVLTKLHVPEHVLLERTPLIPMGILAAPEEWVRRAVRAAEGSVVAVDRLGGGSLRYWVASRSR